MIGPRGYLERARHERAQIQILRASGFDQRTEGVRTNGNEFETDDRSGFVVVDDDLVVVAPRLSVEVGRRPASAGRRPLPNV
jgi:hypothetical protein